MCIRDRDKKVIRGGRNIFSESWINNLGAQVGTATSRAGRLYHKSLGNLIALQEKIVEKTMVAADD